VLLFIKYISDKYAGQPFAPITIPPGASFKDMVALKGKPSIGDDINKKIIAPLANANKLSDMPDFNDATKLGTGKEMVDRLTDLIAIFEGKALVRWRKQEASARASVFRHQGRAGTRARSQGRHHLAHAREQEEHRHGAARQMDPREQSERAGRHPDGSG
jgi:hypothetical protein